MKKLFAALGFAVSLGGAVAQAQTKPDIQCLDTQVKVVSALALAQGGNGVVDCKEKPKQTYNTRAEMTKMILPENVQLASVWWKIENDIPKAVNTTTSLNNQFSLTPFVSSHGTGIAWTVVLGSKDLSVGLKGDGTSKVKHGTFGIATRVSDSATVSITGSAAHEDGSIALGNKEYDGKILKGEQVTFGVDVANIGPFKTGGISVGAGKTHDTELNSSTALTTENRDVDTPIATEHWKDTYSTKTTTNYSGSTWNSVGVRGVVDIGAQGELSLRGGAHTNNIMGSKATGGVGYTHYMGTTGKIELGADLAGDNKVYSAKYTKPLSEGWSVTAGVSHLAGVISDTKAMVGFVWTPGTKSKYTRPTAYDALDANRIVTRNISSAENTLQGLGSYGNVTTTTGPKTLSGSEKTGETIKAIAPTSTLCGNQTATVGDADFTCAFTTNSSGTKTWTSSNTAVATVDVNGRIHYVGAGTATITVRTIATSTHLAESKSMTVTVNSAITAPIVPSNIPTSFSTYAGSGNINLSAYMQPGWNIQVVSVADPGAGNGVWSPSVNVSWSTVSISTPLFYGWPYNIDLTLRFTNSAWSSSNFVITANNIIN
jgi:hypothetical protein